MKLLLIEDDRRISALVRHGLEAEGFAVETAFDGVDGLWMATEGSYDLIVLDILLPGRNGFQICADLRAAGNWTPILMLTAKDGDLNEAEALDTGADDFLSKPFSYVVLVARLRALLRRGAGARPVVLRVGDVELDVSARTCRRAGELVELTPRELAVLEYLMRRQGEVVPKAEILGHVWDFAFEGGENVVEVHVSALRRKLGPDVIETVRGGGYRVNDKR